MRDEASAIELIARLRERGLGGVTFFPLSEAGVSEDSLSPEAREIEALFDMEESAAPFVRFVARRSRIAPSLNAALLSVTNELERIVTPDGEVVGPGGLMRLLGGETEEAEILRRESEMPVLRADLARVRGEEEILRAEEAELLTREEQASIELKLAEETLSRLDRARNDAAVRQGGLETELAMLTEERRRLEEEARGLEVEVATATEEEERLRLALAQSGEDTAGAQARFDQLRAEAEALEEARDQRVREANEREMEQVKLENQLRAAESRLESIRREMTERSGSRSEIDTRIELRSREAVESIERIEELRLVLAVVNDDRNVAERAVEAVKQSYLECQERLGVLEDELKRERHALEQVTSELHAGDLGRMQTQAEAEQIRARILDEHKIDLESWTGFTATAEAARDDLDDEEDEEGVAEAESGASEGDAEYGHASVNGSAGNASAGNGAAANGAEAGEPADASAGDARLSKRALRKMEDELAAEAALSVEARTTRMFELRRRIQEMGNLNFLAEEEYKTQRERLEFHQGHAIDLRTARADLLELIRQINEKASEMFAETFSQVQAHFVDTYQKLFPGGEASLKLVGTDPLEGDIEISARPKGKKVESIRLLSSGERSLSAIALLFAIYLAKPSPICLLDEVDAPLDDANLDRFLELVKHFSERTQFIMITHNKKTMASAGRLFGVTMEEPGVSKIVSVRLNEGRVEVAAEAGLPAAGGSGAGSREFSLGPGPTGPA